MHACSEGKLLGAEKGCPGVWYSLGLLPLWQVPDSRCSRSVPRVFLALVEEAEDRGGVVAQGGGKVRRQAWLCCWPAPRGVAVVWQEGTLAPSYRRRGEAGAAGLATTSLPAGSHPAVPGGHRGGADQGSSGPGKDHHHLQPGDGLSRRAGECRHCGDGSAKQGPCAGSRGCAGARVGAAVGMGLRQGLPPPCAPGLLQPGVCLLWGGIGLSSTGRGFPGRSCPGPCVQHLG